MRADMIIGNHPRLEEIIQAMKNLQDQVNIGI
jgi:hypothetical protein